MKALTVRQPWAWAIATGEKSVENRSQQIRYRGLLAIHAGQAWARAADTDPRVLDAMERHGQQGRWGIFGQVIATARLVDCHASLNGCCIEQWGDRDAWHWVLAGAQCLAEPVAAKGRLGLWDIELPVGAPS